MNLQAKIGEDLSRAVEGAYEHGDYSAAIVDAIHFLGDLIRDRSGLDSDAAALVGAAFGGQSPKLKVNQLQTESEWNEQKGLESLLRGIYKAIRNPRSHKKRSDPKEDADAIIAFIDYLVRVIDRSKAPYSTYDFLAKVFDPNFVETDHYAKLLVQEIPAKKRLDTFIVAFRRKGPEDGKKLKFFFHALFDVMTEEEEEAALDVVQEELATTTDDTSIRLNVQTIPPDCWSNFGEAVRLRIENKLLKCVKAGQYNNRTQQCELGVLGTWITSLSGKNLLLKNEFVRAIASKLGGESDGEKDYVFNYVFHLLYELEPQPSGRVVQVIKRGLIAGDKRFHDALAYVT